MNSLKSFPSFSEDKNLVDVPSSVSGVMIFSNGINDDGEEFEWYDISLVTLWKEKGNLVV